MKNDYAVELGKLGGNKRAKNLSAERRKEIAYLGGLARARLPKVPLSPEHKERIRIKECARKKARYALRAGKLIRSNCFCGKPAVMHHADYSKPYKIKWLCSMHHEELHKNINGRGKRYAYR